MSDSNCPPRVRHVSVRLPAGHPERVGQVSGISGRRLDSICRAIIARRKSNSSSRCPTTAVRQVSGTCPSGCRQVIQCASDRFPAGVRQVVQQQSGVRQKLPGRCATGASDRYSAGFRQACVTGVRQVSGVRQELSNRCPAPLRQVPGLCPTGVSDRCPTDSYCESGV